MVDGFRIEVDPTSTDHIGDGIQQFLECDLGPKIQGNAKRTVPVDTFSLRDSIIVQVDRAGADSTLQVGVDPNAGGVVNVPVDYALFVEQGTSRQAAQPYLRPAVYQARGQYR